MKALFVIFSLLFFSEVALAVCPVPYTVWNGVNRDADCDYMSSQMHFDTTSGVNRRVYYNKDAANVCLTPRASDTPQLAWANSASIGYFRDKKAGIDAVAAVCVMPVGTNRSMFHADIGAPFNGYPITASGTIYYMPDNGNGL